MASRFSSRFLRRCHHFTTATTSPTKFIPISHTLIQTPIPHHPHHPIFARFLSTRPRKEDIGARARRIQNRRLWGYALTFSCIAGFVVIVLNQFQDQLIFYLTPTDVLEKYNSDPSKSRFRLGGLVLEKSVTNLPSSPETQFVVTDLITDILIKYEGSLPDLFREGHSVVVEGFIKPFDDEIRKKEEALLKNSSSFGVTEKARSLGCYFAAVEVLAKHDEKYMPAEVANAIEKNKKLLEEEEKKKSKEEALLNANASSSPSAEA